MTKQIPFVDYLELGDQPHLVANECTSCGARFFDRRNACARCFGTEFTQAPISNEGEVKAFTLVAFAAPGVPVTYTYTLTNTGKHRITYDLSSGFVGGSQGARVDIWPRKFL